ncbi:hypothetical protein [Enterococcus sp. HY326]|uniref:hypothetical protein n=1 Tax=Enterococcus sp. HY326 TaxID=2971265 RepID=UPI00223EE7AE|nr:hypothetical protein [Enterococcus sp. HY326]
MAERKLTIGELLSIKIKLDTGDEDEALQWFPVFYLRPDGTIHCQFFEDETALDKNQEMKIDLKA